MTVGRQTNAGGLMRAEFFYSWCQSPSKTRPSLFRFVLRYRSVPLDAHFSRIALGDEGEIGNRESQRHRPPNGGEQQCATAGSESFDEA